MVTVTSELVVEKTFETLEKAQIQAGVEASNTGGFSVPVIVFRQGQRTLMSGAIPLSWVKSRLETRSVKRGASLQDTRNALNRPEIPEHSRAIANYIKENFRGSYILPSLTLNVQQRLNLYTVDYESHMKPGYLLIPATAKLGITDGQHRRRAIELAMDELNDDDQQELGQNSIAVMVTCETEVSKIHQDFADCSRTKPLPPSTIAVFDMRNPANRVVMELESQCKLFKGRIDSSSKTLSKKSTYLFLSNQLRQLVKELLAGSYALPDAEFERRARERLGTEPQFAHATTKFADYINAVAEHLPIWKKITELPADGLEASQIPPMREEGWVCLTATGLNLIGRVGHHLMSKGLKDPQAYAKRLAELDWRREAEIWQGNIVQNGKILTAQGPLKAAFTEVSKVIGLQPAPSNGAPVEGASTGASVIA
jgi:DNA sulfur modification protein DndB